VQDSTGTGKVAIKVVDLNTSQVTTLPESNNVILPLCSPDGRYVVASTIDARKLMLYDFNSQKWSELVKVNVGFTEWSKDGKYIYFDTGLSDDPAIYRVRVADRKVERVASLKGFRRVIFAWTPWSGLTPDGSPLLLHDVSSQEVYALDFEAPNSKARPATHVPGSILKSAWRNTCVAKPICWHTVELLLQSPSVRPMKIYITEFWSVLRRPVNRFVYRYKGVGVCQNFMNSHMKRSCIL